MAINLIVVILYVFFYNSIAALGERGVFGLWVLLSPQSCFGKLAELKCSCLPEPLLWGSWFHLFPSLLFLL